MTDYIPPFPPRYSHVGSSFELLKRGRKNLLALWPEQSFRDQIITLKILNQRIIICNSPETVRQAFVTANASFERKSHLMRRALKPLIGDGLFISDGETWRTRRKAVGSVIHSSRLQNFVPIMLEPMVEMRDHWAQLNPGSSIDVLREMAQLTAEVICRTVFGRELGHENSQVIVENFAKYQQNIGAFDLLPMIGAPDWLTYLFKPSIFRSAKRIATTIDNIVQNHYNRGDTDEPSMLNILINAQNKTGGLLLDKIALRNETIVLFMAGYETTASTLAWAWFLLSQTPEYEKQLHTELDSVLGGRIPTFEDVPKLVYTRAIIEETLRLYPPVPILSRQAIKDEKIQDRDVPVGSLVAVVPWLLHRHKNYWDKPDHFIPARFLPEAEPPDKFAYIPFSVGPRVCAGQAFGLTEAILCLAVFAQKFRLELAPGVEVQPIAELTLRPGKNLPMIPKLRNIDPLAVTTHHASPNKQAARCPFAMDATP